MGKKRLPDYFLETSLQISRRLGHPLVKSAIRNKVEGKHCVSSFYVLMEYKRVLVKSLIEFRVLLEEDDLAAALHHFSQSMRPREPKLLLSVLAQLLAEHDLANDKRRCIKEIEMLIEASLEYFDSDIDGYIENMQHCPLARASIQAGYERFLIEIDCVAKCKVDAFWKRKKSDLKTIIDDGAGSQHQRNRGFAALYENVQEAYEDSTSQKTKPKCKKCGDVIIALEAPSTMSLLTFDRSFESLSILQGKRMERLPSLAALKASR